MHQPAISDGSEQEWKREMETQHAGAQATIGECNSMARAKRNVFENPAIFTQGDFTLGSSIQIVEDGLRKPLLCHGPEVFDAYNVRRSNASRGSRHEIAPASRLGRP
jgi:hypothetical protein